jgi:hypothetical protein
MRKESREAMSIKAVFREKARSAADYSVQPSQESETTEHSTSTSTISSASK